MLKTLYLVDMDRCTLNTEAVMNKLAIILEQYGIDHSLVESERQRAVQDTGYIGVWEHLQQTVFTTQVSEALVTKALLLGSPDTSYLYAGAQQFLSENQGRAVVMTFGSPVWQLLKARLSGIDQLAPIHVVDTHFKGQLVADARTHHGHYAFRVGDTEWTAASVVLIDDKAAAFTGLPTDCRGYQLNNGPWYDYQRGELPAQVEQISTFAAVNH